MSYVEDLFDFHGAAVVVTGGGGTLGGAIAQGFARAGATVALWGRTRERLEARAAQIAKDAPDVVAPIAVAADLGSERAAQKAVEATVERTGKIDVLVNAAGGNRAKKPITEWSQEDYAAVVHQNLLAGCVLPTQAVARRWIADETRGSIINIASMSAHAPLSGVSAYSAGKAAVVNATQSAAGELAPHGIRVNAISPGFFLADQNRALLVDPESGDLTERGAQVIGRTPFGRFGEPAELVGACLFLASAKAAGFVTGAIVPVDGGFLVDSI